MARRVWDGTDGLRRTHADVRWIEPSRYHVTLRFLGEVDVERAAALPALLDRTARVPSFSLSVRRIGAFMRRGRPPIFWAGVEGEGLFLLKERLDRELVSWGLPPEGRRFRGHVTLGRGKRPKHGRRRFDPLELDAGTFQVEQVLLVESELDSSGARYTTRYGATFSAADPGTLER